MLLSGKVVDGGGGGIKMLWSKNIFLARTLRLESLAAWPHLSFCCPPLTKNPGYAFDSNVVFYLLNLIKL